MFPVYALLFAAHGIGPGGIAALFVLWSAASFVLEVPSGAWADTVGRRRLLTVAAVASAAGFATWAVWPAFVGFAAGFVLWALAGSLSSGTFEALTYDELRAVGGEDGYARVIGVGTTLALVATTAATLAAVPLVAAGGLTLTVWASVAICVVQLLVVRSLPPAPPQHAVDGDGNVWHAYVRALRTGVAEAVRHAGVRSAVVASAGLMGLLAFDEFFGLLLDERRASAVAVPAWLTVVGAGQAVGGLVADRAMRWTARAFTALTGLAGLAMGAGALVDHPAGIVGIAAGYGALQLAIVVADARLQDRIESGARATVTSVSNLLAELLALGVYGVVGLGAPHAGYGVMLAVVALPVVLVAPRAGRALGADPARRTSGGSGGGHAVGAPDARDGGADDCDGSDGDGDPAEVSLGAQLVDGPVELAEDQHAAGDDRQPDEPAEPSGAGAQAGEEHQGPGTDLDQPEQRRMVVAEHRLDRL